MSRLSKEEILSEINNSDKEYVIGIDEVGTGSLVGKIFVCAFIAPKSWDYPGLGDSKALSEKKRNFLFKELTTLSGNSTKDNFITYDCVGCHPDNIDEFNWVSQLKESPPNMHHCLMHLYAQCNIAVSAKLLEKTGLSRKHALAVVDGILTIPGSMFTPGAQISLPKADSTVPHVMAASIIAKVIRDSYMVELSKIYPNYGWDKNKGYPSKEHKNAIDKYGVHEEHRQSYEPIKTILNQNV